MITVIGAIQATVRIDMTMPGKPQAAQQSAEQGGISPWEQQAYGDGGRFGSMTSIPSGDPAKDRITVTFSGCAYQVARRLGRHGLPVSFLSVAGEDPLGLAGVADLGRNGVDTSGICFIDELSPENENTETTNAKEGSEVAPAALPLGDSSLTSVKVIAKNFLGDTEFWREDVRLLAEITPRRLQEKEADLREAEMVFADGSLPAETLVWLSAFCQEHGVPLYYDPASVDGGSKGSQALAGFTGIMPGRREAEAMSGLEILSADQMMEAGAFFAQQGIQRTIITMKGGGIYYKDGFTEGVLRPRRVLKFAETSGAGDVVTAELLAAFAKGCGIEEAANNAMEAAADYLSDAVDERRY